MKICINTLALYTTKAGMGNYIYHLVHGVTSTDNKNQYYILMSRANRHFFNIKKKNVHLFTIGTGGLFSRFFVEQFIIPRFLSKYAIDVYHNPGFTLPIWKNTAHIVTVADMTYFSHPQYHIWWKVPYFILMIPLAVRQADAAISISKSTTKDILKYIHLPKEKIKTIYLGADESYHPLDKTVCKKYLSRKYNIQLPFILSVGMLEPRKNIVGLLQAFSSLQLPHKLVIIGKKGWMYRNIFTTVKSLHLEDRVVFLGYVPDEDLPYFYSAASLFVYPSFYEGFGLPVIEAMASGCPVITSDNSSMDELAHGAAVLIDPTDITSLQHHIEEVLMSSSLQNNLIARGFKRCKEFGWHEMARRTIATYNQVYKRYCSQK